jgi:hypothetical protein
MNRICEYIIANPARWEMDKDSNGGFVAFEQR